MKVGLRALLTGQLHSKDERRRLERLRQEVQARAELERRKAAQRERDAKAKPKKARAPRKAKAAPSPKRVRVTGTPRARRAVAATPARAPVPRLAEARTAAGRLARKHGTFTPAQLAQDLNISEAQAGPVLARLQAAGAVRRYGRGFTTT